MNNFLPANTIILIRYPFTDLSSSKVRPALIVRDQIDQDIICLPITSSFGTSDNDIEVQTSQTIGFTFPIASFIRTQKIMTLNQNLIIKNLGTLEKPVFQKIKQTYLSFLTT